ncbi:hypothetical protein [Marinobacter piscensis]|uniref:hypothetical protein n=1 Tax=Marinobacter piscensis TaxID=1562308 RepID=UPI0011A68FAC|nr:hypothetical protein [Marinobacter piscensis]
MRHACFFIVMSLMLLSGCGMEDTGSSAPINPATDVDYPLSTFTLKNQEGLEPVLPYTVFYDVYLGATPQEPGDDNGFAAELRAHLDTFLQASSDETGYKSVRNPIDLMHEVIRSGRVDNFNEGRQLMVSSVTENRAATYNTPANNALIRFSELHSGESTPAEDQTWLYPMLDWTYNRDKGKVYRAMQFSASSPEQPDDLTAEIASASSSSQYAKEAFGASGFNQPEYAATSMTGRTRGKVELLQEFVGLQRDTLTLTQASGMTLNGSDPDCVKAVFQYSTSRVTVFTSKGKQTNDPDHCGNQEKDAWTFAYDAETISHRQQ